MSAFKVNLDILCAVLNDFPSNYKLFFFFLIIVEHSRIHRAVNIPSTLLLHCNSQLRSWESG